MWLSQSQDCTRIETPNRMLCLDSQLNPELLRPTAGLPWGDGEQGAGVQRSAVGNHGRGALQRLRFGCENVRLDHELEK